MLVGVDHIILACAEPEVAAAELESLVGLAATGGGRHDAFGTFNRLIWLGDSFIELVGVADDQVARGSWFGAHVAKVLQAGPAGYAGLVLSSDDVGADIARLRGIGAALSDATVGERRRADGEVVRWWSARLPRPDPDLGLCFLIEHDIAAAEWRHVDRAARAQQKHPLGTPARLVRAELPVSDVRAATLRLLRDLGLQFRPSLAGKGARDASVGAQTVRVIRGRRPVITIRAGTAARRIAALGCDWDLLPY